jgi:hypothetical protein
MPHLSLTIHSSKAVCRRVKRRTASSRSRISRDTVCARTTCPASVDTTRPTRPVDSPRRTASPVGTALACEAKANLHPLALYTIDVTSPTRPLRLPVCGK